MVTNYQQNTPKRDGVMLALAMVSLCVAVITATLAFLPVSPAAVVCGGIGVGTGVLALLRARGAVVALAAVTVSTVAIVLAVVMVFTSHLPAPARDGPSASAGGVENKAYRNDDLGDVMAHELEVEFGDVTSVQTGGGELSVTVINKMDVARSFTIRIGAFDGGAQIGTDAVFGVKLGAHARQQTSAYFHDKGTYDQLKSAEFKVTGVQSRFFGL